MAREVRLNERFMGVFAKRRVDLWAYGHYGVGPRSWPIHDTLVFRVPLWLMLIMVVQEIALVWVVVHWLLAG